MVRKLTTLWIRSSVFATGERIPAKYTGEGPDVSPPLEWGGVPEGTAELALISDDNDAPRPSAFTHWVLHGLRPEAGGLEEGAVGDFCQGYNDYGTIGWRGPMPPVGHGTHYYYFWLFALDKKIEAGDGLSKQELLDLMDGHILGQERIVGTYDRAS
ncbi:MAG: YbhB/YbcL family Raf kinase inhibitor-like protein [Pseudonocardia sp.]|nr:YbhB/YbcL family Raf kinase inhibitor-like protein [Pseudonocardia sp.]